VTEKSIWIRRFESIGLAIEDGISDSVVIEYTLCLRKNVVSNFLR